MSATATISWFSLSLILLAGKEWNCLKCEADCVTSYHGFPEISLCLFIVCV